MEIRASGQDEPLNCSKLGNNTDDDYPLELLNENWQHFLVGLYSLTALASFVLNLVTAIVLSRGRKSVLRKYLINLALSDLLIGLFSIPFSYTEFMLGRYIFPAFLCPVQRYVVSISACVSISTMIAIGIDRHSAIMEPLRREPQSTLQQWTGSKVHVVSAIWVLAGALNMPEFLMHSLQPFCHLGQTHFTCSPTWPEAILNIYAVFIYLVTIFIPLLLLSILYGRIALKLLRHQAPGNVDSSRDSTLQITHFKVVKMLLVVVVLFLVTYCPLQTFYLFFLLFPGQRVVELHSPSYNIYVGSYFTFHWLSMAHGCLNPIIYCFMNDKFRSELYELLGLRHVGPAPMAPRSDTNSTGLSSGRASRPNQHRFGECQGRAGSPICEPGRDQGEPAAAALETNHRIQLTSLPVIRELEQAL